METDGLPKPDNVIFGEIQVLLAEKRTALAGLRTGIIVQNLRRARRRPDWTGVTSPETDVRSQRSVTRGSLGKSALVAGGT